MKFYIWYPQKKKSNLLKIITQAMLTIETYIQETPKSSIPQLHS